VWLDGLHAEAVSMIVEDEIVEAAKAVVAAREDGGGQPTHCAELVARLHDLSSQVGAALVAGSGLHPLVADPELLYRVFYFAAAQAGEDAEAEPHESRDRAWHRTAATHFAFICDEPRQYVSSGPGID
jgi:hypothetical protein